MKRHNQTCLKNFSSTSAVLQAALSELGYTLYMITIAGASNNNVLTRKRKVMNDNSHTTSCFVNEIMVLHRYSTCILRSCIRKPYYNQQPCILSLFGVISN